MGTSTADTEPKCIVTDVSEKAALAWASPQVFPGVSELCASTAYLEFKEGWETATGVPAPLSDVVLREAAHQLADDVLTGMAFPSYQWWEHLWQKAEDVHELYERIRRADPRI